MAGARIQHGLPTLEDAQGPDSVSASRPGAAPAGRQHGSEDDGRRQMKNKEATVPSTGASGACCT